MSEQDRKNIATIISSILISTTKRMTIYQLNIEYQQHEGHRIPYEKFGCSDLEQFLRTLNHTLQVCGHGMNAELAVIIGPKSAHINDLISKQKIPKNKKCFRPTNYRYCQQRRRTVCNYRSRSHTLQSPSTYTITPSISPTLPHPAYTTLTNSQLDKAAPQYTTPVTLNTTGTVCPDTSDKGAVPKPTMNNNKNSEEEIYFSDDEEFRNTRVPRLIQDRLWRLIVKHPQGILCSNLPQIYKKNYEDTLSYSDYGYRSIAQMCVDLRGIFHIVQLDESELKLFDKTKPIPQDMLNIAKKLQFMKIKASMETPTENALPQADVEDIMTEICSEKVPPDVVGFGTRLEQQWIDPGTNEQDFVDVAIGEVYDPSKFWMNLKLYSAKLNNLMDSMQVYYATNKDTLLVPYFALKNGLYVSCVYSNEYHRARIVDASQKSESTLKVYFFDYGTIGVVNIQGVCYLHNQFAELPEQAIRGRLAGICPSTENEQWSRAASARFLSLVMQKDLLAQLIRIDEEQRILDIVLADTSEEDEDFFINDALVAMDYAIFTFQTRKPAEKTDIVPIVRYIHLYPTHYELENGLVPTAIQMINMHQAGLVIEQIYPHYFKDAKTNESIVTKRNLPINYSIEQPYYEENQNNQCYDEAIGGNEPICEIEASASSESLASSSVTLKNRWEDIIDEVELNSVTVNNEINDVSLQTPIKDNVSAETEKIDDSNSAVSENNRNTNKEFLMDKCSSQCAAADSTQTVANNINGDSQINNSNIEAKTKVYQTNNYTQINVAPKITNDNVNIKKPLRPPPGYNNITPQNTTTCNYPYTPTPTPNNYIANQTYINFPVAYNSPAFMVPYYYNCAHPYEYNTYSSMNNIMQNIQYLLKCGYTLTPEQHKYLQSLNWSGFNTPHENNYGVQTEFPHGDVPPPAYPGTPPPTKNLQNSAAYSNYHQVSSKDNTVMDGPPNKFVLNPIATTFIPDRVVTNTSSACVDQCIQVDEEFHVKDEKSVGTDCTDLPVKDDHVLPPAEVDNNDKVTVGTHNQSPSDIPHLTDAYNESTETLTVTNESQNNTNKRVKKESKNILSAEVNNVQKSNHLKVEETSNDEYDIKPQAINETIIPSNNDVQDVESIYEDCESNSNLSDTCGTKLITSISIGELNMHIVSLESEYYFLLSELSKKIFPKSLTVLQIRKLFVATPCTISIEDIRLKKKPELKKELLMYDLIKEDEFTVDAVPIKYFEELTKIIPMPGSDNKVTNLLEEIDCFLSEHNLENVY